MHKNQKPNRIKQFVRNHPSLMLGALTGVTTLAALQHHGIKNLNDYLKQNDLYDKYYATEEE